MHNKDILVTGSAGFIGQHTVRILSKSNHVTGFDSANGTGNITNQTAVFHAAKGMEVIVHLAAMASVQACQDNPEQARKINVEGTQNILKAAEKNGAQVVFASSSAVYGNRAPPLLENGPVNPLSRYAQTKLDAEKLCQTYSNINVPCTCLRFFNVYGPGQKPDSQYAAVIPAFLKKAERNDPLVIYGDGSQTRDFVYVDDVVKAISLATGKTGPYNVGTSKPISILELAQKIIALTQSKSRIEFQPARQGEVQHSVADIKKMEKELGFSANVNLEQGLANMLKKTNNDPI